MYVLSKIDECDKASDVIKSLLLSDGWQRLGLW